MGVDLIPGLHDGVDHVLVVALAFVEKGDVLKAGVEPPSVVGGVAQHGLT